MRYSLPFPVPCLERVIAKNTASFREVPFAFLKSISIAVEVMLHSMFLLRIAFKMEDGKRERERAMGGVPAK